MGEIRDKETMVKVLVACEPDAGPSRPVRRVRVRRVHSQAHLVCNPVDRDQVLGQRVRLALIAMYCKVCALVMLPSDIPRVA